MIGLRYTQTRIPNGVGVGVGVGQYQQCTPYKYEYDNLL
jgi:hypothetical protein